MAYQLLHQDVVYNKVITTLVSVYNKTSTTWLSTTVN